MLLSRPSPSWAGSESRPGKMGTFVLIALLLIEKIQSVVWIIRIVNWPCICKASWIQKYITNNDKICLLYYIYSFLNFFFFFQKYIESCSPKLYLLREMNCWQAYPIEHQFFFPLSMWKRPTRIIYFFKKKLLEH